MFILKTYRKSYHIYVCIVSGPLYVVLQIPTKRCRLRAQKRVWHACPLRKSCDVSTVSDNREVLRGLCLPSFIYNDISPLLYENKANKKYKIQSIFFSGLQNQVVDSTVVARSQHEATGKRTEEILLKIHHVDIQHNLPYCSRWIAGNS